MTATRHTTDLRNVRFLNDPALTRALLEAFRQIKLLFGPRTT